MPARTGGLRFTGADAVNLEHTVVASSGDLACTVGFERSHVSIDGGPMRDGVLRVTHIYRRIDGDRKLAHRHADFPPRIRERPPTDKAASRRMTGALPAQWRRAAAG